MQPAPGSRLPLLFLCSAGVLVRLAFLGAAHGIDFVADEGFYVHSALAWNHYGFYGDQFRYLWPPGYPFFLAQCLTLLEERGILLAKGIQVLASASIGLSTMLIAQRVFGQRAARIAGLVWCLYLPLIGFTHTLWTETLFLALFMPGLLLVLTVMEAADRPETGRRVIAAGLCFAGALYLKEAVLLLLPLIAGLLWLYSGPAAARRLWTASLFLLSVGAAVLPWSLRNAEVYGRVVPMGATLGENAFRGLNAQYTSFDTVLVGAARREDGLAAPAPRPGLVSAPGPGWQRSEELPNTIDRQRAELRQGLYFAREHPGWLLRSRIQKLADWLAPTSFFLRHQALGSYADTPLGGTAARRATSVWALLCPLVVLALAIPGATRLRVRGSGALFGTLFLYFLTTALLVSMSRFRMPVVPLCIVLAAGALARGAPLRLVPTAIGLTLLLALWWIDLPLVAAVFQSAWGPAL